MQIMSWGHFFMKVQFPFKRRDSQPENQGNRKGEWLGWKPIVFFWV